MTTFFFSIKKNVKHATRREKHWLREKWNDSDKKKNPNI